MDSEHSCWRRTVQGTQMMELASHQGQTAMALYKRLYRIGRRFAVRAMDDRTG